MVVGAITASESIQAQIYSFPPKSYGLIEEPAKYEIFLVPITLAKYVVCAPNEIHFMDHVDFYLFLEQEKRWAYQPLWYNFNLLTEGRTIHIWGPNNWKFRIRFQGEENTLRQDDIVEGDARYRNPVAYYNQYYSNLLAREVFQPEDHQNEPHQPNALRQDICDVEDEDDGQSWYEEETSFHFNEEPAQ